MMRTGPTVIAIFCILVTAIISGILVYIITTRTSLYSPSMTQTSQNNITPIPTSATNPSISVSAAHPINPTTAPANTTNSTSSVNSIPSSGDADLQAAMKTLSDFNEHLHLSKSTRDISEYDKAAALFDWNDINNPAEVFEQYYVAGNPSETFAKVCANPNFCLEFNKILKVQKQSDGSYNFTIQFKTEDGKVFVNSSHVAGQFLNYTDFIYNVKKVNGAWKVTTPPNFFTIE